MDYGYVCWKCRHVKTSASYGTEYYCVRGHHMQFVEGKLIPRSRDDHKMWRLAESKLNASRSVRRRPRRSGRRSPMADWERELLKAAK